MYHLRPGHHVLRTFMLGLLAALPLAATALVLVWAVRLVNELLGPGSLVGRALAAIGLGVTGSEVAGYAIGLGLVLLAIFVLGLLVQTRLKDALTHGLQRWVQRIPLVGTLYDLVHKFVGLLSKKKEEGPGSMSPVWLHFGGPGGAAVLGLLSSPEPIDMNGQPYLAVLLPTAPVPVGGALLYVPQHWVSAAPLGMDGLTSVYVSMGLTSSQHLPVSVGHKG
jgi:uncharacterized membrane protein